MLYRYKNTSLTAVLTELFVSIEQVFQFDIQFLDAGQLQVDFLDLDESLTVLLVWSSDNFLQVQHGIVCEKKNDNNKF